ncbi:surfactant protein Bb isoform X1 [Alosa sapidissima]|uniref:surfactant protein Bb isoform X1 n=2 Tax=Alosa sapidissima TaxID=34773 RepID=UPI001C08AAF4|nr:surfactant protein Bb isoform X1 [Alosa sapidissima]
MLCLPLVLAVSPTHPSKMIAAILSSLVISTALSVGQTRVVVHSFPREDNNVLMLTEGVCEDCTKITQLLMDVDSPSSIQLELLRKALHGVCLQLPKGEALTRCYMMVDKHLPSIMKHQIDLCPLLGLCPIRSLQENSKPLTSDMVEISTTRVSVGGTKQNTQGGPVCALCVLLLQKMEDMLPKERTEEQIVELMGKVCSMLPDKYSEKCNDFLQKYGKQVVDFLLSDAAPHTICVLLHLCLFEEVPPREYALASDCTSCLSLSALTRFHLGRNATETQTASLLQNICQRHPNAVPQCEAFIQLYGPRLPRILGKHDGGRDACEKEDFCQSQWWGNVN